MNVKHLISLHSGGVMPPFVCVSFLIFPLDNNSWGQIVCLIVLSLSPSMKVVWPRSSPYSNLHPSSLFHIFAKNNFTKYFTNRNKEIFQPAPLTAISIHLLSFTFSQKIISQNISQIEIKKYFNQLPLQQSPSIFSLSHFQKKKFCFLFFTFSPNKYFTPSLSHFHKKDIPLSL